MPVELSWFVWFVGGGMSAGTVSRAGAEQESTNKTNSWAAKVTGSRRNQARNPGRPANGSAYP